MAILDDIDTNCDAASVYQFIPIRFLVLGVIAPSRANQDARRCRTEKLNTRSLLLLLVTKPLLPPSQRLLNVVRPAAAQDFLQACDLFLLLFTYRACIKFVIRAFAALSLSRFALSSLRRRTFVFSCWNR